MFLVAWNLLRGNVVEKKKVFISYKRNIEPDESVALEIFTWLSKDHDVFIDLKMMVGTKWSQEIEKNLQTSDFFISLISANSIKSDMVSTEIQMAYKHSRLHGTPIILPVKLNYFEDLEYALTAYLDSINYLTWRSYSDTQSIIMHLQQAINGDNLSDKKVLDLVKQRAKDKEISIRKLLSEDEIKKARVECERLLEQNSDVPLIHLLSAIAILMDEGPSPFLPSSIRLIEKHLKNACKDEKVKFTAYIIWGIIKHDHYYLNGLAEGKPSLEDIKRTIERTDPDLVDVSLLELISIDSITRKALGLHHLINSKS
jgi:hypothetical protein